MVGSPCGFWSRKNSRLFNPWLIVKYTTYFKGGAQILIAGKHCCNVKKVIMNILKCMVIMYIQGEGCLVYLSFMILGYNRVLKYMGYEKNSLTMDLKFESQGYKNRFLNTWENATYVRGYPLNNAVQAWAWWIKALSHQQKSLLYWVTNVSLNRGN